MSRRILFLCTGNYYRSRFAEALFNAMAEERGLGIRAFSRGLALERLAEQEPLSPHCRKVLEGLGISLKHTQAFPTAVEEEDFRAAAEIVALRETEHRLMMRERFPEWEPWVTYWEVADVDEKDPREAIPQMAEEVAGLLKRWGR